MTERSTATRDLVDHELSAMRNAGMDLTEHEEAILGLFGMHMASLARAEAAEARVVELEAELARRSAAEDPQ